MITVCDDINKATFTVTMVTMKTSPVSPIKCFNIKKIHLFKSC